MRRLLCALLCGILLLGLTPAPAETAEPWVITTPEDERFEVRDPALAEEIREALTRRSEEGETPRRFLPERVITLSRGGETFRLYYDDLYGETWLVEADGTPVLLEGDPGASLVYPFRLWTEKPPLSTDGVEPWRELLAGYGWTPFFVISRETLTLPQRLTASTTDAADLYFTWLDLFLQDAGYDLTPYLGQEVQVTILGLWETVPWGSFNQMNWSSASSLPVNLRGIVLEQDGRVLGACVSAGRHDCTWKLSLKGSGALALLGIDDPTEYLVSRAEVSEEEAARAQLGPEEAVRGYFTAEDPRGDWTARRVLLARRCANMADDRLFLDFGEEYADEEDRANAAERLGEPAAVNLEDEVEYVWRADFPGGETRYVKLVHESDATGWKVLWCYDNY